MSWAVEELPELKGYAIEWAEPGNFLLSRRNEIYHSKDLRAPFKKIAVVAASAWKSAAANVRLAQRLLRFMVTNVFPLRNGDLFVTFDKSVGVISDGKYRELKGLVRPCRVLRAACAVDENGDVYFGEYLANAERGEMRIYRYTPGEDSLSVAHTFPPASIRHIHGVYFDEVTKSLFCLTGDADSECRMLRSIDGFRTIETVGAGDESWRAVSVLFTSDALYYGTDAEFRANNIVKVKRETLDREHLGEVTGTVFYSKKVGGDLFFTTTAESAPSQKENVGAIWLANPNGGVEEIVKFKKDFWHPALFMFGTIHFPFTNGFDDRLYFNVVAVEGDGRNYVLKRTDK